MLAWLAWSAGPLSLLFGASPDPCVLVWLAELGIGCCWLGGAWLAGWALAGLLGYLVGWSDWLFVCLLIGWLAGWLAGWAGLFELGLFVDAGFQLAGWSTGLFAWLAAWLFGRLVGCLVCWLVGCLVSRLIVWLDGWLVGWLWQ